MILQALKEYYDRKAAEPESGIAKLGWEWKAIPFVINISSNGSFIRIEDTRDGKSAKPFLVPTLGESKGNGVKSNFPWENAEYIFGVPIKEDKNNKVHDREAEFRRRLNEYASQDWAEAILTFLDSADTQNIAENFKMEWAQILKGAYMLFAIDSIPVSDLDAFKKCYHLPSGQTCVCLTSGVHETLKEKEPPIKGGGFFKRTPTESVKSELHIVSFNEESFTSFGKKQGFNAPISQTASFAYTNALNHLLQSGSRQKMLVGDATVVWWAERSGEPLEEDLIDFFAEPPKDDPDRNVQAVEALYRSVDTGAFAVDAAAGRFYVLGLAPNAARISVRFWTVGTAAELATRFRRYFEDLEIARGPNDKKHLSLWRLLVSTAPLGKSENIAPNLAGETMRSILAGTPFPETLLQAAIRRCVVEHAVPYARAKLIKGCLNRKLKNNNPKKEKELTVSLDKENTNTGYLLGRLFAVLEKIQTDANPGINATIRDKFYATASSSPVAVFANLMRLKNHHLAKIGGGGRVRYEQMIGEIAALLPPEFPAHLSLDDQGRFAIGYYHQNRDLWTSKKDKAESADKAAETTSTEN